jgi:hypothetical protein
MIRDEVVCNRYAAFAILCTTDPALADICSYPRLNRFELVDTTDRPRRVFGKTPPPSRGKKLEAGSKQAGRAGKCTKSADLSGDTTP